MKGNSLDSKLVYLGWWPLG